MVSENTALVTQRLLEKNIRPSLQRMAVYGYLLDNHTHPTADAIYSALSPSMPTLSKTTVYNTLRQFVECGLVQSVTIEDGELRYDADTSNHVHFKCVKCGGIYDVMEKIELPPEKIPQGFTVEKTQTNVWGKCSLCC